jgi:hypothetical protein
MRSSGILLILIGLVATGIALADEPSCKPTRTRRQFAEAMNKITEGMSQEQVVSLLGPPDDVRTQYDPGGIFAADTKEVWRYGTSGHLTTATLGKIYIDDNERVLWFFGKGKPPSEDLVPEEQLRGLLRALDEVPSYDGGWIYNPQHVIRAVNLLQPLGKRRAMAVIEEYLRVAAPDFDPGRQGAFLVLRVLFAVPEDPGYMPDMFVGASHPPEPKDMKLLPRFPIIIQDDIPLLLADGYSGFGEVQRPDEHLPYFRKHGTLRGKPLAPTDTPFAALDRLVASPQWLFAGKDSADDEHFNAEREKIMLGNQILRLMDSVFRVEPDIVDNLLPMDDEDAPKRKKIIREASKLRFRWDAKLSQYTFLNGSSLPPVKRRLYRRAIWKPNVPIPDAQIVIERYNRRYVEVDFTERFKAGVPYPPAIFRVFDVTSKETSLAEFETGGFITDTGGGRFAGENVELNDGAEIQIELTVGGKSHLSPIFKP